MGVSMAGADARNALVQTGAPVPAALTGQPIRACPDQRETAVLRQQDGRQAMPSRALDRAWREGRPEGGYMPVPSPRMLSALAYDRGEDFDPGVPALTPALVEDLSLIGGARAIEREPPAWERRRRRDRERRAAYAAVPSWFSVDDLVPTAFECARRLV